MSDQPTPLPSTPQEPPVTETPGTPRLRVPRPDRFAHTPQATPSVARSVLPQLPEAAAPAPASPDSTLTLSPADYRTGKARRCVRTFKINDKNENQELDEILNGDAGEAGYIIEDRLTNFFEGTVYVTLTYTIISKK